MKHWCFDVSHAENDIFTAECSKYIDKDGNEKYSHNEIGITFRYAPHERDIEVLSGWLIGSTDFEWDYSQRKENADVLENYFPGATEQILNIIENNFGPEVKEIQAFTTVCVEGSIVVDFIFIDEEDDYEFYDGDELDALEEKIEDTIQSYIEEHLTDIDEILIGNSNSKGLCVRNPKVMNLHRDYDEELAFTCNFVYLKPISDEVDPQIKCLDLEKVEKELYELMIEFNKEFKRVRVYYQDVSEPFSTSINFK